MASGRIRRRQLAERFAALPPPTAGDPVCPLCGRPIPPGNPPSSSELLSDELERYARDPVYEAAVAAT